MSQVALSTMWGIGRFPKLAEFFMASRAIGIERFELNHGVENRYHYLERFASRIVGVHLHDVIGIDDHQAAGAGEIDWDMVARYLPATALRTCEFRASTAPAEVVAGVQWLVEKGCVRE